MMWTNQGGADPYQPEIQPLASSPEQLASKHGHRCMPSCPTSWGFSGPPAPRAMTEQKHGGSRGLALLQSLHKLHPRRAIGQMIAAQIVASVAMKPGRSTSGAVQPGP